MHYLPTLVPNKQCANIHTNCTNEKVPQYQDTYRNAAYFSSEILEDGSTIHSCSSAYTTMTGCASLQVPVDTPHRELTGNKGNMTKWAMQVTLQETTLTSQITCSPALWERETAFAFALPLSFPALPPACMEQKPINVKLWWRGNKEEFVHVHKPKLTMHKKTWQNISAGHKWSANKQFIVRGQSV